MAKQVLKLGEGVRVISVAKPHKTLDLDQFNALVQAGANALMECGASGGEEFHAEDLWYDHVKKFLPRAEFRAWEDWCHKATTEERITDGLRRCARHMMGG